MNCKKTGGAKKVVKKGDRYSCDDCGIVVIVDEACGCAPCDLVCCGAPMKSVETKEKE